MAGLYGLLQDIGECITRKSKSDDPSSPHSDDFSVESRFRSVLPNLLHAFVLPSKTENERELTAILKLITHICKNYPGVFFNGKASAVLPILGRVIPLFAEPSFCSHHHAIFETVTSLLSLLRTGEREAYRQFFLDSMLLLEDLLSVASFYAEKSNFTASTTLSITCFCESFYEISSAPALFCDLPPCCKPAGGHGILVDVTDEPRWQPFSIWTIKILSKCLTEGTLHVEGLISPSFMLSACNLLCYGGADLHMSCFDFARTAAAVLDAELIPVEKLILSIASILAQDIQKLSTFRNCVYDSTIGACLTALHFTCHKDIVESTAMDLLRVFPLTLQNTESPELKVALCSAYTRIVKTCHPNIWGPESLLKILSYSKPCLELVDCIQVVINSLGPFNSGGKFDNGSMQASWSASCDRELETVSVGEKRVAHSNIDNLKSKRQRIEKDGLLSDVNFRIGDENHPTEDLPRISHLPNIISSAFDSDKISYANYWRGMLIEFIGLLNSGELENRPLTRENAVMALSILCIVFSNDPYSTLTVQIFQQVLEWIPWIFEQAMEINWSIFDLSIYLEAAYNVLLLQSFHPKDMKPMKDGGHGSIPSLYSYNLQLLQLLKLPWTQSHLVNQVYPLWKAKCLSVKVLSLMGIRPDLDILDLALQDNNEEVRVEAVTSIPVFLLCFNPDQISYVCRKIEVLGQDKSDKVNQGLANTIGYISCLYGSLCNAGSMKDNSSCKLYVEVGRGKQSQTSEFLSQRFWCPQCGIGSPYDQEKFLNSRYLSQVQSIDDGFEFEFGKILKLFFKLLLEESSEEVQVACVGITSRVLMHMQKEALTETRSEWIQCIDKLLLHDKRSMREAFCSQICGFLSSHVLDCLFSEGNENNKTKEQRLLDKLKHALAATEDPGVFETLLETAAEIMKGVDFHGQIFFFALALLLDQLDNPHISVRMTASRLILNSCQFHCGGGFDLIFSKFTNIRDELFEYLCSRLVSRPAMIREFSEAVVGIKMVDLVRMMIPIVLPKLVVSQKDNDQSVITLHELAKHLDTDLPLLLLEWCHKVLAFVLLQADGKELLSALQFYEMQTGSDTSEIFAAVLPALLDELVRFLGDSDTNETSRRTARVPQMIQEVASIVTGSNDLPQFLRNHFVGLINSIDRKMLRVDDPLLQKQALKCIEKLIEMIGSHLSTYVPKIMVLLMHAVEKETLQIEGLRVWHCFIQQLAKVSPLNLKHIASQVVASLIPFLERYDENTLQLNKAVEILEELIVSNRHLLDRHVRELPLLPNLPILKEVNKVIQEAHGSMSLRDQLRHAIDGLNHENLNVRHMVASELCKLLNVRREDVTAMILGEVGSDLDVISSLITALLKGCAEESRTIVGQRLKLVCAECLGALGAVDPAKVKVVSCRRFKIECSDDDLIFELINNHLARVFRAASDTVVQDSAALAIQELLKLAGCQASLDGNVSLFMSQLSKSRESERAFTEKDSDSSEMNKRGQRLWDRFSNYIKEIIAPCLTSKFQLQIVNESSSAGPIYKPSMSFRRWIYSWIRKLTKEATGSRANIFNACRGIVRHDMGTAIYLLPYLVLNAVCHGTTEARQSITEEILSVLTAAASDNSGAVVHGGQSEVCIQAIFTLLDNLGQWVDDLRQEVALSQSLQSSNLKQPSKRKNQPDGDQFVLVQCNNVTELLTAVPEVTLARASLRCQAHARSLLYFESHVRKKSGSFNPASERSGLFDDEDISFLMEIYSGLDEPDGLFGLAHLRTSSTLQDQILINEKAGNWSEALTCCEQALQMEPDSVQRHSGVLNCLLHMCHLQAMVTHVDGLISRITEYKKTWCMQGVQAAWRLGRWDLMDEYLSGAEQEGPVCSTSEINVSFDLGLAKILQALRKKDSYLVAEKIAQARQALLAPIAAAGMESYMRAYPLILKLHMLSELEDFYAVLSDISFLEKPFHLEDPRFSKLIKEWENRLRLTQPSLWAREPLLALRRLVFGASNLRAEVGNCWLQYAKLCRAAGHYETANRAILEAQSSGAPNVHMEKAKLLWGTRKTDRAIAELQQVLLHMSIEVLGSAASSSITSLSLIPPNHASVSATQALNQNQDAAKTILLYTRWIHHTGQKQKEDVLSLYTRVKELQPKWEKGYFFMAKYCDDLLVDARKRQEENQEGLMYEQRTSRIAPSAPVAHGSDEKPWWNHLPDVLLFYAKGLRRGHSHLFQALPRLLTLWFEFGSKYQRDGCASNKDLRTVHVRVMGIMRGCLKDLPTYQWLTALSQLVSRICHQNNEVALLVKHIIISVLQAYPQQALWTMAAVSKSTVAARREAAAEIIQGARKAISQGSEGNILFTQFAALIDYLIKLCFHSGQPKAKTINIATEFSALKRMMPVGIIMPIQQALTLTLPTYSTIFSDLPEYDPFSHAEHATIAGISDEAEILSSLQRPKKVIFHGSDGIDHPFLCKPKDDLRKDARMMEFTAMINRLLSKYPESRRRKLYIRTFAVIPLTEDCGMVEWVPHTRGLRQILQDIYIACGRFDRQKTNPMIKKIYDQQGQMPGDEMLRTKILPMFPPVFHKWFLNTFSEPAAWFRARVAYAHTTAVWSMVGHIVGLGDRHGENILFDSTTGDCVHVDFSCLFDKGLQLERPELVPFRLTQNMIDGLGITGYEGIFLRVCEITLSVLRTHRETLMSVLETFIHDPLVEWTKSHKSSGVEVQNPHAQRAISNIEARLQGVVVGVGAAPSLPLAVEGQAHRLIAEAVSHKNLGKMYIWWMPWF
ncbi:hypothetical protein AMTRI_Chr09g34870 [Amborella trichopoda]